jgi:hypothetical protein
MAVDNKRVICVNNSYEYYLSKVSIETSNL